ncbi:hypothetical protein V2G26_007418 [Clonostachys chloroleuca]
MTLIQKEFFTRPAHPLVGAAPVSTPRKTSDHKSCLQWYEPNTTSVTDDIITHLYIEEVCFIEGGLLDVTLGEGWGPGSYAYRLPGMKHGPYKASPQGCLQFVKLVPPPGKSG